jgi:hypothetical protein
MIKRTINYEDFDGNQVSEDAWFHLTKTAIAKLAARYANKSTGNQDEDELGIVKYLQEKINNGDNEALIDFYKTIVLDAYGKRSEDGRSFIQTPQVKEEFEFSAAFDEFFFDLITNEEAHIDEFIDGLLPKNMVSKEQMDEARAKAAELLNVNK